MEEEDEDIGSLIKKLRTIFISAASFYQASVAKRENVEGEWYRLLQGKLNEARATLEQVPNGDLVVTLNIFMEGNNWDDTSDVARMFLYGYLAERFGRLQSVNDD